MEGERDIRVVFPEPVSPRIIVTSFNAILRVSDSRPNKGKDRNSEALSILCRFVIVPPRAMGSCSLCSCRWRKALNSLLVVGNASSRVPIECLLAYFWRLWPWIVCLEPSGKSSSSDSTIAMAGRLFACRGDDGEIPGSWHS